MLIKQMFYNTYNIFRFRITYFNTFATLSQVSVLTKYLTILE